MSEARGAKQVWATQDGGLWRASQFADSDISYTRTDLYDEAVRQRDECAAILRHISNKTGQYWNFGLELQQRITAALVACDAPPLARGDVKTGKVITSAELIEATDTPEIRGAVAPEGGGRHT